MARMRPSFRISVTILLVAIVSLELAIRAWERKELEGAVGSLRGYVVLGPASWHIRPHTVVVQPERYGDITYRFNGDGFRTEDYRPEGNVFRVLFLGDSVTFGLSVEAEERFSDRVQAKLAEMAPDRPIESVNLALYAYTPRDYLHALKTVGLPLEPDIIILQLYMNDFEKRSADEQAEAQRRIPLRTRLRMGRGLLVDKSALLRRIRQLWGALEYHLVHDLRRTYFVGTLNAGEPNTKKDLLLSVDSILSLEGTDEVVEIHEIASAHGIPLLVMLTPNEVQVFDEDYDVINDRVAAFCEEQGIAFWDPLELMRASPEKDRLFLDGLHLSQSGHELVATQLISELRKRSLLMLAPPREDDASTDAPLGHREEPTH